MSLHNQKNKQNQKAPKEPGRSAYSKLLDMLRPGMEKSVKGLMYFIPTGEDEEGNVVGEYIDGDEMCRRQGIEKKQ